MSLAFKFNLLFSIIEIIGGILTNFTAIIADTFYNSTDVFATGLAVF
ncbi:cation transporter [Chryseobacterium zhengzhouense]|uniref:Cation transporter n=1 Tax=Chryseobacterium zhengzhouense TaxID=1636086 RepID=A0ABW2M602_9FLAO